MDTSPPLVSGRTRPTRHRHVAILVTVALGPLVTGCGASQPNAAAEPAAEQRPGVSSLIDLTNDPGPANSGGQTSKPNTMRPQCFVGLPGIIGPVSSARTELGDVRNINARAGKTLKLQVVTAGSQPDMGSWSTDPAVLTDLAVSLLPYSQSQLDTMRGNETPAVTASTAIPSTRLSNASRRPVAVELSIPGDAKPGRYTLVIRGTSGCPVKQVDPDPPTSEQDVLATVTVKGHS